MNPDCGIMIDFMGKYNSNCLLGTLTHVLFIQCIIVLF